MSDPLGFIHRFIPGDLAKPTLLMLHGTGGDENDLVSLGQTLLPGAAILSPRGKVLERGAPRFFRRIAEGVFDLEDLAVRTDELAEFLAKAARHYGFDPLNIVAAGFSNGANIAANLLLRKGDVVRGAVLLSPMLPFDPGETPSLAGVRVFIGAGTADPIVPVAQVQRLNETLEKAGADVTVYMEQAGHTITPGEVKSAQSWFRAALHQ